MTQPKHIILWQRVENALIALGVVMVVLAVGRPWWMLLLACCWGFHVAVDRAVGYGLKIGPFRHTHLGVIGGSKPAARSVTSTSTASSGIHAPASLATLIRTSPRPATPDLLSQPLGSGLHVHHHGYCRTSSVRL